jgi:cholesterol transport system auxiliary component
MIRPQHLAAVAAVAITLAGCGSLLGGGKPADLYRFGQGASATEPTAPARRVGILRAGGTFQREAAGDRILTVTGGKAAYIAETRWVAPASVLWDQALVAAFSPSPVRLLARGQPGAADYILRVDVRNFEAHYDNGPKAAPNVLVRVHISLSGRSGGPAGETEFQVMQRAADNRVGAIVDAYDAAVKKVLQDLVAWTDAQAKPQA